MNDFSNSYDPAVKSRNLGDRLKTTCLTVLFNKICSWLCNLLTLIQDVATTSSRRAALEDSKTSFWFM